MSEHKYKFNVTMACGGCSGAVERVIKKLEGKFADAPPPESNGWPATGVKSYEVSLEKQSAEIVTADDTLDYNTVLSSIKKTGKKVTAGEADGVVMPTEVPAA
jgi:copper chaperone